MGSKLQAIIEESSHQEARKIFSALKTKGIAPSLPSSNVLKIESPPFKFVKRGNSA